MLAMVVGVVALTGWRPGRTWSLLLAGLSALVIADIAYTLQSTGGTLARRRLDRPDLPDRRGLPRRRGLAARRGGDDHLRPRRRSRRREMIVPALFAAVMIGLFAMQYFSATSGLSTVLWAATMIAVIVRLAMSDRENKTLLEQVRTDPLTGLGNRGRMQVDLEGRCERASESNPASLLLFDLNGFKRYNDTFGHPGRRRAAGPRSATPCARRSARTASPTGSAATSSACCSTCAEERFDEVARKRGDEALTASGKGFEVSASWGAAAIPGEATTPSEALQLADVRMYAQKESRRLAHESPDIEDAATVSVQEWPQEPSGTEVTLPAGTIRYREAGEGPPVVFVHGYLVDGRLWDGVVDRLSDRCRCIAPDWPIGAQQVAMSPDADLTPYGIAAIVAGFLEALDLDDVTIVGNDSGGAMSQVLVTRHPERIGRLVLTNCDTHENFPPGIFKAMPPLAKLPGGMTLLAAPFRIGALARAAFRPFAKTRIPAS